MNFEERKNYLIKQYEELATQKNAVDARWYNGCFERYINPVITAEHIPLNWRYDFNKETNPFLMERLGVNAAFNSGAIELNGKICLVVRVEGFESLD